MLQFERRALRKVAVPRKFGKGGRTEVENRRCYCQYVRGRTLGGGGASYRTCVMEPSFVALLIRTPSGGMRWMERPGSLTVVTPLSWGRPFITSGPREDGELSRFSCLGSRREYSSCGSTWRGIPERKRHRKTTSYKPAASCDQRQTHYLPVTAQRERLLTALHNLHS